MPLYDFKCGRCGMVTEHYIPLSSSDNPQCDTCGSATQRLLPRFSIVWTRELSHYNDKTKEFANEPGHTVYRVKSSRRADGAPEPEYITTPQQQARFCREEGLVNPKELSPNMRISADGKKWEGWRGMPGQEI